MTNVVFFPKEKRGSPPQTMEEVQDTVEMVRHVHVEETMQILAGSIFDNLALSGFNFNPDDDFYTKDVALAFEALKSMLYKYHGMEYPIQDIAEKNFALQKDGTVVLLTDDETAEEKA
jgi:hypothetical protein